MPDNVPTELASLLAAKDDLAREVTWSEFVRIHHRYIFGTVRYLSRDYDGAMDRYAFVLEELRRNDCQRLRGYRADPRSKFSTWLVVVVRRLCRDFERRKYGRPRSEPGSMARHESDTRRRLVDLLAEEIDPGDLPGPTGSSEPQVRLERKEVASALSAALAELAPEDQLILKLRFADDLPARRIAGIVGMASPFHVYRRLNKLLPTLRARLQESGIER